MPDLGPLLRELPAVTPLTRDVFDGATAERRLCDYFAVATMDGLAAMSRLEATAAAAAVTYIDRTQVGKASAAVAALARGRRHHDGDRPRHPRQSRTDPHAVGRAARIAARCDRLHGHRRRLAAIGATPRRPAHRQRGNRPAAGCDCNFCRRQRGARRCQDHAARRARHVARTGAVVGRTRRPARPCRAARRHPRGGSGAGATRAARSAAAGDRGRDGGAAPSLARSRPRIRTRARRTTAADQTRRWLHPRGLRTRPRREPEPARRLPPRRRRDAGALRRGHRHQGARRSGTTTCSAISSR